MKYTLMKFADNVLSKNEMRHIKGGTQVYCGRTIYYGGGVSVTEFGACSSSNVSFCESQNADKDCYEGAVSVKSYGCYTVGDDQAPPE